MLDTYSTTDQWPAVWDLPFVQRIANRTLLYLFYNNQNNTFFCKQHEKEMFFCQSNACYSFNSFILRNLLCCIKTLPMYIVSYIQAIYGSTPVTRVLITHFFLLYWKKQMDFISNNHNFWGIAIVLWNLIT